MSAQHQTTATRRIYVADDVRYLTIGQVKRRYGDVSDMWVLRRMREHGFPQPVRFGGKTSARRWALSEIEAWEAERISHTSKVVS